jgi:hypothetical protein
MLNESVILEDNVVFMPIVRVIKESRLMPPRAKPAKERKKYEF